MAVGSAQVAVTSTAQIIASVPAGLVPQGPAGTVMLVPDASAEVYIGGVNVSTTNGFKVLHGSTVVGPIQLYAGDVLYAVTATTATLGVLQT